MVRRPAAVALRNGGMPVHANIGLSKEQREGVVLMLTPILADEYLLYTKTRGRVPPACGSFDQHEEPVQ
jgi:hypothetical protein